MRAARGGRRDRSRGHAAVRRRRAGASARSSCECVASEQCKALIHAFFAERGVSQGARRRRRTRPSPIDDRRHHRRRHDGRRHRDGVRQRRLARGAHGRRPRGARSRARRRFARTTTRRSSAAASRQTQVERADRPHSRRRSATTASTTADLIIEAVFENLALKKEVFAALDRVGEARRDPGDQHVHARHRRDRRGHDAPGVGHRPALLQPGATSCAWSRSCAARPRAPDVIATALAFAKRLGKVGVVVGNGPGFVGNRMMFPYMYEAQFLVEDGATPEQVDRALTDLGMAMGIFAVDDMARPRRRAGACGRSCSQFEDPALRKPLVADRLCEMGRFGQKTGKGWYTLRRRPQAGARSRGDRRSSNGPRTTAGIARRTVRRRGDHRADDLRADQRRRARARGGHRAARRRHRRRSTSTATGFPAWRGGPMFYADRVGLAQILRPHRGVPSRVRPALAAGAAARAPGAEGLDVPRVGRVARRRDASA